MRLEAKDPRHDQSGIPLRICVERNEHICSPCELDIYRIWNIVTYLVAKRKRLRSPGYRPAGVAFACPSEHRNGPFASVMRYGHANPCRTDNGGNNEGSPPE